MSVTVGDVGELELVARIRRTLACHASAIECGPGDDAAIVRVASERIVLTTDSQREGVHFRRAWLSAADLGRRALAVGVSDLGAMGARPVCALCTLALPRPISLDWFQELVDGLAAAAAELECPVVGGDVAVFEAGVTLEIAATGELAAAVSPLLRSGARPGDDAWVTGVPGLAAAGRALLEHDEATAGGGEVVRRALTAYRRPAPRWRLGVDLAASGLAHAAMDISDGLGIDAHRMCAASEVGLLLQSDALVQPALERLAARTRNVALDWALGGGDDYELLCAVSPSRADELAELVASHAIEARPVGRFLAPQDGVEIVRPDGRRQPLESDGWDHFGGEGP